MTGDTPIHRIWQPAIRCAMASVAWGSLVLPALAASEIDMTVRLERHAFYRGEEVVAHVTCTNKGESELASLTLKAGFCGLIEMDCAVGTLLPGGEFTRSIRLPTAKLRPQKYECEFRLVADSKDLVSVTEKIDLAHRPNSDRMPVWLWPHRSYLNQVVPFGKNSKTTLKWWADHGMTELAVGEGYSDDMQKALDATLALGINANIMPNGGLTSETAFASEPPESDVWYRGPGDSRPSPHKLLNPFHPRVIAWHDSENEHLMRRVAGYPHVRSAFFNSEIVDQLTANDNDEGKQIFERELGFGPEEHEEPRFVQPGVISDDDKRLRLNRFVFKRGNGLSVANARTAAMVHRFRPDILAINDPFRSSALLDGFPGIDVVGSWTYTNPDPKLMLYAETLRAACQNTNQIPLSIVTLLNYPGEQTPSDKDWTMMGPGRLAVTTWINLSRAPRMLGYYFSSACDPFSALEDDLVTPKKDISEEALPPATYSMLERLSNEVIKPLGGLIRQSVVAPRRIAVLNSDTSSLFRNRKPLLGHYGNLQAHHFYTILAMGHLPADIVLEEQIERNGLDQYDMLVLPQCDVLPQSVYDRIIEFGKRGGLIVSDQYLGPEIPGAMKFDFDFTYREQVTAMAISSGRGFSNWNDHLQPGSASTHAVEGVSALEDQATLESYAQTLRDALDDRVVRDVDSSDPTALVNLLEADGAKYLVIVNDKRDYDSDGVGKYRAVLDKIVPQTATITLPGWEGNELAAYDLTTANRLNATIANDGAQFDVKLTEIGGTVIALYPKGIADLAVTVPKSAPRGETTRLSVQMVDTDGVAPGGIQPVRVTILDADGNTHEASDYYNLNNGMAVIEFSPALNDPLGTWTVAVDDLTAGLQEKTSIQIVETETETSSNRSATRERELINQE